MVIRMATTVRNRIKKKNESEDYSKTKNSVKAEVISGGITEDIDLEEEYADDGFVKELRIL